MLIANPKSTSSIGYAHTGSLRLMAPRRGTRATEPMRNTEADETTPVLTRVVAASRSKKWRARSVDNVLAELDEIVNRDRIKSIIFYDDLFTVNKERVAGICEGILRKKYKFDWKCEGRVNLVDLDLMKLMQRAGCRIIAYGVESANQAGLDYLNKKTTAEQIVRAFDLTHKAGIQTMAYFILGIPVETFEDELKTIELAKTINTTYAQFSVLSPYYGTKVYEDAMQKGWYREVDAHNPMDKDLKRPVILSDNWDERKLQQILKTAHREFYLRPGYVINLLR
jgi:anaerobic magnesium-protoporphyrin IX monomethyl ester cyclase